MKVRLREKKDQNIIITGLITEDDCIAECEMTKEIGLTLTDTAFKFRRFGRDNKHVEVRFIDRKLEFEILWNV